MSERDDKIFLEHCKSISSDYTQAVKCILCDNVLELGINESVQFPYICQYCKDAIAYAKELLKRS